jgi:hypothetical protein
MLFASPRIDVLVALSGVAMIDGSARFRSSKVVGVGAAGAPPVLIA